MRHTLLKAIVVVIIVHAAAWHSSALGTTVKITPSEDNSIYSENNNSNGLGNLFAGKDNHGNLRRALMLFDIADNIAAGATITSVTLAITQVKIGPAGPDPFQLVPLTASWGEGTSSATGMGGTPTTGDATWNYRFYKTSTWTMPGGDFGASSGTAMIGTSDTTYTFASQSGMVAEVQQWLNSPATDDGWLLKVVNEAAGTSAREFDSRFTTSPPTLTVTYTLPANTPDAWRSPVSGNWSDATKWSTGAVPNAAGATAVLNKATTAALTVTLAGPETVGTLQLGNSGGAGVGYTLGGASALTLNNSGSNATIAVSDGTHAINVPVVLASDLVVATPAGDASSWALSFGTAGSIADSIAGRGESLTMSGSGGRLTLSGADTYSGGTSVSGGSLILDGASSLLAGSSLTIGSGSGQGAIFAGEAAPGGGQTVSAVPEPGAISLLAIAALAALVTQRRKAR